MFRKKTNTPQIETSVGKAVNYEVSLADVVRRSERRAWFVAFSAIFMALLLAGGYFIMLPLKERTPFLVMADAYTGTATVARLRGDFSSNSIIANESVNRSNIAHYVIARESFDAVQRDIRDWTVIYTMSSPSVASAYTYAAYSRSNPASLVATYGNTKAIRVEITSITLLDNTAATQGPGTGGGDAAVRFRRILVDKSNGALSVLDSRIANLRYNYDKNLALDEKQRYENPLGFQVISYRVDSELVSNTVPAQQVVNPAAAAPTQVVAPVLPTGSPGAEVGFGQPSSIGPSGQPMQPSVQPAQVPGQLQPQQSVAPGAVPSQPAPPNNTTNGVINR